MNFEQSPNKENLLQSKIREVEKLKQQQNFAKDNKEYQNLGKKIEELYTENNNELLDYEKEKYGK